MNKCARALFEAHITLNNVGGVEVHFGAVTYPILDFWVVIHRGSISYKKHKTHCFGWALIGEVSKLFIVIGNLDCMENKRAYL